MIRHWLAASVIAAFGMCLPHAVAQADSGSVRLWREFTTSSTKGEIKAFKASWPKKRVEVISGCPAGMGYRYIGGKLVTLSFLGQDRGGNCFQRMFDDFRTRMGVPETQTTTFGGLIGYGNGASLDTTSAGVVNIWREGDRKTKLVRTPGQGYNLFITVREDKYLY